MKGRKHTEEAKRKIGLGTQTVHARIIQEIKEFEAQGYRCVPVGGKVRPDFIAIKDNKVLAVEVEHGRPNYAKYDEEMRSYVDDVVWLLRKK